MTDPKAVEGVCAACGGELYQRDDDTVETVANRLEVYNRSTAPLIRYYAQEKLLHQVDGNQSPDLVYEAIEAALKA